MTGNQPLVNLADFETAAAARLPRMVYDYYAGGALDELTLRDIRSAYDRIPLWYRTLVDVSRRSLATTVLGESVSMPVLVAPTAFHAMAHPDGELATARAARAAGTLMIVSTLSNTSVEDIARETPGPLWFQLYIYRDRAATSDLVQRVEAAGCGAIMLTVDAPVLGPRERDVRNRFALPDGLAVRNLLGSGQGTVAREAAGSGLAAYVSSFIDPAISWRDVEWLRSVTRLPLVVKGLARADDARRAVAMGVDGVVVSNHGGRQLDTAPATIDALPYVVEAVAGGAEVYVDGGVRRGVDVIKALARGARAVLLGRPVLWGLAVEGERGVTRVLEILRGEIDNAMALCGCPSIADIDPDLLRPDQT
ncbi:MAG TPA: alpha-hydroxy acid oxidase [Candidatus Krumholzibacteria bacterium]|nr:alpha-hydroxy acid oxidase [Candidatus Krumholzibacteria bacterium]